MMRWLLSTLSILLCAGMIGAQPSKCGFTERLHNDFLVESYDATNIQVQQYLSNKPITPRAEKWLQVVVHVVTNNPESIPYGRVVHQIDVLNKDFAKQGENIYKLNEAFASLAADTEIRFCLAHTDPDGNSTSGVTYTATNENNIALKRDDNGRYILYYDELGGKTGWDPHRYINIWVAEFGNGISGYGSAPGTAPHVEENGVVIDPAYFGAVNLENDPSGFSRGHTLTHEMGHFLGLLHIWGNEDDSCTDSDEVEDTPNAEGPYLGCPSGTQISCGESNMYQNFMDFTNDRCLAAFTHGQATRMQAVLALFYSSLPLNSPCIQKIDSIEQWSNKLVWAYDAASHSILLFHPDAYSGKFDIDIFSIDGRLILHDKVDGQQTYRATFDKQSTGIYLIRIKNGKKQSVRKIIVY